MSAAGGTGAALATIILFVFGFLSWYSLVTWARAADVVLVKAKAENAGESLSAVWERVLPNGKLTTYIPDLGCVALTIGCLLFYSAFIGDIFGSLVSGLTGLPDILRTRWFVLLLLHAFPILPLCLKKDLSSLKYSSMTGLVGIFYTIFFVGKRLTDGTYAEGGEFFDLMPSKFQPAGLAGFPQKGGLLGYVGDMPPFHYGKGLLVLSTMGCVSYACHYNAVKVGLVQPRSCLFARVPADIVSHTCALLAVCLDDCDSSSTSWSSRIELFQRCRVSWLLVLVERRWCFGS